MKRGEVTPEMLRAVLSYNPASGELTWLPRSNAQWSGRWAGKPALTCVGVHGYRHGAVFGIGFLAHRVAWALAHGEWPNFIDHINGDRADNRLSNIRNVRWLENGRNYAISKANKSGHTGVSIHQPTQKWRASIAVLGKHIFLGSFPTEEQAVAARKAADAEHGFHANHGRKPQ